MTCTYEQSIKSAGRAKLSEGLHASNRLRPQKNTKCTASLTQRRPMRPPFRVSSAFSSEALNGRLSDSQRSCHLTVSAWLHTNQLQVARRCFGMFNPAQPHVILMNCSHRMPCSTISTMLYECKIMMSCWQCCTSGFAPHHMTSCTAASMPVRGRCTRVFALL